MMEKMFECVFCCKLPEWDCWEIGEKKLWSLRCHDGKHFMSTSYWGNKEDSIVQWNKMMEELYAGYAIEPGLMCDNVHVFN